MRMSLLDELHRRVDQLSPEQQKSLKLWLDFYEKRQRVTGKKNGSGSYADPEVVAIGMAGLKLAAQVWPKEDFSDWPGFQKPAKRRKSR